MEIKYLPTELVPELYGRKNTIVDVLCQDVSGRKFCVEMQMEWSNAFMQRVLFNASKLYVTQLQKNEDYSILKPVYSLNLVNEIFEKDMPDCFIHNYRIVHDRDTKKVIEGLHFTFIELPKFTPHTFMEKRMSVLWLRFLTEINSNTREVPADLLECPEISKALEELKVTSFTDTELRTYDKFWDTVRTEKTLLKDRYEEGMEEGEAKGLAKDLAQGEAKGSYQKAQEIAKKMLSKGLDDTTIMEMTGLSQEEIKLLKS